MSILAAIDIEQSPDRIIDVGYELATLYDETLTVLHVMSQSDYEGQQSSSANLPGEFDVQEFTMGQAEDTAAQLAADAVDSALDEYDRQRVETQGRVGAPANETLRVAEEIGPRYIIVGGRNRSPARQAIFGSVSHKIMRNATQPVVTIMEE